jgi:hypothetical protein
VETGENMNIRHAIDLACKPEELFPWIANPDKALLWQKGVKGGEIIQETHERVGTTFREVLEENGNTLEMVGEITNFIQDKLISFHLVSKIHRVEVSYAITGKEDQSTLTVESNIHWKFPMNIMSLILGGKMKEGILRQTESEFAELKRLCETKPVSDPEIA